MVGATGRRLLMRSHKPSDEGGDRRHFQQLN
jgi:hypothetical protein